MLLIFPFNRIYNIIGIIDMQGMRPLLLVSKVCILLRSYAYVLYCSCTGMSGYALYKNGASKTLGIYA